MKKPRKFDRIFAEVCHFEDGEMAVSRRAYSKEEALELFRGYEESLQTEDVKEDCVRWQLMTWDEPIRNMWILGTAYDGQRGAQPVWIAP